MGPSEPCSVAVLLSPSPAPVTMAGTSGVEPTQTLCSLPLAALTNPGPGCRGNARPECLLAPGTCPPVLGIDRGKQWASALAPRWYNLLPPTTLL